MSRLWTKGLEDEPICLLVGGQMVDKTKTDYVYVLDCDKSKAYEVVESAFSTKYY